MADKVKKYTKETAPKSIRISASPDADPIFVYHSGSDTGDTIHENVSIHRFPFPAEINHALALYRESCAAFQESEFVSMTDSFNKLFSGDELFRAMLSTVELHQDLCVTAIERWFTENNWNTVVSK